MLSNVVENSEKIIPIRPDIKIIIPSKKRINKDGSECKIKNNKESGKSSEVYAFKTEEEIKSLYKTIDNHIEESIKKNLYQKEQIWERNKLLLTIGLNIGIRASDLRQIRWNFFFEKDDSNNLVFRKSYKIMPKKTSNRRKFVELWFNESVVKAVSNYINKYPIINLEDYVFTSRKGKEPLLERCIGRIIKDIAKESGIKQNVASHTLRKTFAYWRWHEAVDKEKMLVILCEIFNHSSLLMTKRYIGIMSEEKEEVFNDINLGLEFC